MLGPERNGKSRGAALPENNPTKENGKSRKEFCILSPSLLNKSPIYGIL
jgi:hypothetical protein